MVLKYKNQINLLIINCFGEYISSQIWNINTQ